MTDHRPEPEMTTFGMREWVRQRLLAAGFAIGAHRDDRVDRFTDSIAHALAAPRELDAEIEEMAAAFPRWKFMFGYEVYDPIPGSPGELNHLELVGQRIWWASASVRDGVHSVIKSAERQPSLAAALRELRSKVSAVDAGSDRFGGSTR